MNFDEQLGIAFRFVPAREIGPNGDDQQCVNSNCVARPLPHTLEVGCLLDCSALPALFPLLDALLNALSPIYTVGPRQSIPIHNRELHFYSSAPVLIYRTIFSQSSTRSTQQHVFPVRACDARRHKLLRGHEKTNSKSSNAGFSPAPKNQRTRARR